ncbi:hypothetical protein PR003_g19777 [Phytophthora rubi]|uniref:Uncharacterized protein n=1 Tax=Phytophthora rubi TaxID=129364 RepID=A0A6A4DWJ2_9STRA|nr:hypothetical protein PR002_g27343 [Phytophthora rubi]KAE8970458.1 hypothetical protein PR001_g27201 [Phytophthora rubi]KAE9312383.1 hypothetical protein PR003_g19777 [Phytophthora rubi]
MEFFASIFAVLALLSSGTVAKSNSGEETNTIDQLYADAVTEGGNIVLYHGGDTPTSQNTLHDTFVKRFPKMNFTAVVDYSKYHNVRIDNQLETDTLVPDVVALQTLQDFTRWAKTGVLLPYKPANFSKIHSSLRDKNGAWLGYSIYQFSFAYNTTALDGLELPATPADLVDPRVPDNGINRMAFLKMSIHYALTHTR